MLVYVLMKSNVQHSNEPVMGANQLYITQKVYDTFIQLDEKVYCEFTHFS